MPIECYGSLLKLSGLYGEEALTVARLCKITKFLNCFLKILFKNALRYGIEESRLVNKFKKSSKPIGDRIKGLKLRHIDAYWEGAAVHKAPQYPREKKSLLCTAA